MESTLKRVETVNEVSGGLILIISGLAVGAISYGNFWWTIGLSLMFPVLMFKADTRLYAFLVALLYHMGATRSLALAAGQFFGHEIFYGIGLWLVGNGLNAFIYSSLWHEKATVRLFTIPLAVILTAIPPLGILGWANPLTAAGVFFPGSGLLGFAYLLGAYAALSTGKSGAVKAFGLISMGCLFTAPNAKPNPIKGLSTNFHKTADHGAADYDRQIKLRERSLGMNTPILLLPEAIVTGGWTEAGQHLWAKAKRTVLMGAEIKIARPENVMVNIKSGEVYSQRQPVPFSMWRPFDASSYASHWFEKPTIAAEGLKIAPLICYEGFLVWPVVHSYLAGATHIAASGNYWWARETEIPRIHESIVKSWSRLFSMPYAMAVNL